MVRPIVLAAAAVLALAAALPAIAQNDAAPADDIDALRAEIEALRGMLPSQSHAMMDVDYQFANLWFAGEAENWPLARFYLNETVSHIGWTIRLRPVRTTSHGPLELTPIFESMRTASLAEAQTAIDAEDKGAFETAYAHVMDQCHACHVAAEKPHLHPHIPDAPASRMIDMTPPSSTQ